MGPDLDITDLVLRAPVVLFALTIHEFMHAYVAWRCGDDTALRAGRVTLNPLAHLDPLGTIMLFVGPIGWAKPVPVQPGNFAYETRRRDDILVSGAGVAANFALGVVFALILRAAPWWIVWLPDEEAMTIAWTVVMYGAFINFGLAVFNLLPLPPLDGSHILQNLLPPSAAIRFAELRRYGPIVLLILILGNRFYAEAEGTSLLGYPVRKLVALFAGF
jgi:Zn-dependent protease